MATYMTIVCNSPTSYRHPRLIPAALKPPPPPGNGRPIEPILQMGCRKADRRGISLVTRGAPTSTTYIFAFALPLSLLAATIVTSARIADKLDQKFFEEQAINQAILEGEEYDEDEEDEEDGNDEMPLVSTEKEETAAPVRARNRPRREAESSSKQN